jgi:hypothetical protein
VEPTRESIEREFPGWEIYRGFGQPWARLAADPDIRVRGEDWADLRDQLNAHLRTAGHDV